MPARFPTIDLPRLLHEIQTHRDKHKNLAESVEKSSRALLGAVQDVSKSSSGSWFGWHADIYYRMDGDRNGSQRWREESKS